MKTQKSLASRLFRFGIAGLTAMTAAASAATGCLDRPVGESSPNTTNVFVDDITQNAIDKIDLLFMIDNSISMADKQKILEDAVPVLVSRLVNPVCVDVNDETITGTTPTNPDDPCATGFKREFKAIKDIHIGVVSSSLGAHGGTVLCSPIQGGASYDPSQEDNGHLVGSVRAGVPGSVTDANGTNLGFLFWGPGKPGGEGNADTLVANFKQHVVATGEVGCGFEASLESWFRFLIDPTPPKQVIKDGSSSAPLRDANGNVVVDDVLLNQRANFLRPDSLVAVAMLTDENDCSIKDFGPSWILSDWAEGDIPRGTAACAQNPNDPCCRSCQSDESGGTPAGCTALGADPECAKGKFGAGEESRNLRCYDNKRRFGIDFLYPTFRYIAGLSDLQLCPNRDDMDCSCRAQGSGSCNPGPSVPNPLYSDLTGGTQPPRDSALVFLAGIVGVPWQDIATDASLTDPNSLAYLSAAEITAKGRWDVILGDLSTNTQPTDPFMVEGPTRPGGNNPITNDAITQPGGADNAINGHDYVADNGSDLQYACVFPLDQITSCAGVPRCDCANATDADKPVCNGTDQVKAKGYPGRRHLQVLRDFGENAIVASICPKITNNPTSPGYGYTPAVSAIINRLKSVLNTRCLPRKLAKNDDGSVACKLVEATFPAAGESCDCSLELRTTVEANVAAAVRKQLKSKGSCGTDARPCADVCLCQLQTPDAAAQTFCETNASDVAPSPAWCYIDDPANPLVQACPATEKQLLRLVGSATVDLPRKGSILSVACLGAPTTDVDAGP